MASTPSVGNQLYLYRLLSEALGFGRQAFLPRVEEALEADGIAPQDLGFDTARELFEKLDAFCQVDVFKGGRVYVTLVRVPEWDEALASPAASNKGSAKGGKAKPWKKGKKSALKPIRPKRVTPKRPKVEKAAEPEVTANPKAEAAVAGEPKAQVTAVEESKVEPAAAETKAVAEAIDPVVAEPARAEAPASAEPAQQTEPAESAPDAPRATTVAEILAASRAEEQARREAAAEQTPVEQDESAAAAQAPLPQTPADEASAPEPAEAPVAISPKTPTAPTRDAKPVAAEPAPKPVVAQVPAPAPRPVTPAPTPKPAAAPFAPAAPSLATSADLPQRFSEDVLCKSDLLALITRLLPMDVDPMAVLDEDWRVARATGTLSGSRSRVTFPLRYLREDGSVPVELTIRRQARPGERRRWSLQLVDGDDGTGAVHETAGLEGLPQAEAGSWADLGRPTHGSDVCDPVRELAQLCVIGTWDLTLGGLARTVAPERWDFPGEGVGRASRLGILREHLAVTLHRVREQGLLETSADGSFAAWNTGLVTPLLEDVHACLEATGGDIPWRLLGFATAGSGELGTRIVAELPQVPRKAAFLSSIDDVALRDGALVVPDYRALLSTCLDRLPRGFLAAELEGTDAAGALGALEAAADPAARARALSTLSRTVSEVPGTFRRLSRALDDAIDLACRRARQSYRTLAPAYDPATGEMRLLAPLALVDDAHADCALVLALQPSGTYQAISVSPLPRAYASARIVSAEVPDWLRLS